MREFVNWRRIPPKIPHATAGAEYSNLHIAFNRVLDYVKTDKRYLIELEFPSRVEVALFERFLLSTSIRVAFYSSSPNAKPRIFMIHPGLDDTVAFNVVWKWACAEMARIQSAIAMEFPGYSPGKVLAIGVIQPNGSIGISDIGYPVKVYGTSNMAKLDGLFQNPPDTLKRHLKKCEEDSDYNEAVTYAGQALGFAGANEWANLYRAFEVIRDQFGGDKGIIERLPACSKNDIDRFTRTVNHQEAIGAFSRHARLNHQPPPNPISFDDAVTFVMTLLKAWLESRE
jgi:hypothetical protein